MGIDAVELGLVEARRAASDIGDVEPAYRVVGRDDLVVAVAPAEPHQVVAQRLGQVAQFAVLLDPDRAVPLRQLRPVGPVDQRDMAEFGHLPVERAVDLGLAKGVVEVVVAADHVGDRHVVIVDHDRQIIGRRAVGAQEDQIVEFGVRHRDLALHEVPDRCFSFLRCFEADHRGDPLRRLGRIAVAPGPVVAHRAFFGAGFVAHRLEFGRRTIAVIGAAGGEQLAGAFGVARGARGLVHDLAIPAEAEPGQSVDDRGDRLPGRAQPVGVLDAQPEDPAVAVQLVVAREQPVEEGRAGAADMEKAGRRGGKADDDAHGHYANAGCAALAPSRAMS